MFVKVYYFEDLLPSRKLNKINKYIFHQWKKFLNECFRINPFSSVLLVYFVDRANCKIVNSTIDFFSIKEKDLSLRTAHIVVPK